MKAIVDVRWLALCRIGLAVALLLNCIEVGAVLFDIAAGELAMPRVFHVPLTSATVTAWTLLNFLSALMLITGILVRPAALSAAALGFAATMLDQQVYTNHYWLMTLLLALLAFAPADRRLCLGRSAQGPYRVPSTAVLLMLTQVTICYAFGALSKVNPWWIAGDELRASFRFELVGWVYTPLALAVIVTEIFIAVGFWFRSTRRLALLAGVGLHVGIVAVMHGTWPLLAFSVTCLSTYPLMMSAPYPLEPVRRRRVAADVESVAQRQPRPS